MDSLHHVPPPLTLSALSRPELEALLVELLGEVEGLKQLAGEQREEIARLKGLKGRPTIKPSGMEKGTEPAKPRGLEKRRGRGKVTPRVSVEDQVVNATVPPGSRFKGYQPFLVQDLVISARATCYQRECWVTPDGRTILAPLPEGIDSHFGPELRRFVLMQYHQGQTTLPRLAVFLRSVGVSISKRQLQRLLTEKQDGFLAEALAVLRTGLEISPWISVDRFAKRADVPEGVRRTDTGARHAGKNGYCTQIGNDWFTWFGTRASKSRVNFLDLLRAGHTDYVLNDAAFDYMRDRNLSAALIARLANEPVTTFANQVDWLAHLGRLEFAAADVTPDPILIATEGALWGSIQTHDFLSRAVVLSDDAGQFNIGQHALCWVHAERLVHKLSTFTDQHRAAQSEVRGQIWDFYADLKAYKLAPTPGGHAALSARFDLIFLRRTGFITLDRLLSRLHANKAELLMVLDHPEIPLHTNGSENDIRCQVTRRKVSAGTRSDLGRDCRDALLGLGKTCGKLGIDVWDYLGSRLKVPGHLVIPTLDRYLRDLIQPA